MEEYFVSLCEGGKGFLFCSEKKAVGRPVRIFINYALIGGGGKKRGHAPRPG